jgi:hypothetical protein
MIKKNKSDKNSRDKLKIVTPQISGKLFGNSTDEPWGQHGDGSWMQAGPPWVQSGSQEDNLGRDPLDDIFDIGGILNKELLLELSKEGVSILKGSNEEKRWRLSIPKTAAGNVKQLLVKNKISYIKGLTTK